MQTTIEIKHGEDKIEDIIKALLARARRLFPDLNISGQLVSMDGAVVYRVLHELALMSGDPWLAIVDLTTQWESKTEPHRTIWAVEGMVSVVRRYDIVVAQTAAFGIIKPRNYEDIEISVRWDVGGYAVHQPAPEETNLRSVVPAKNPLPKKSDT